VGKKNDAPDPKDAKNGKNEQDDQAQEGQNEPDPRHVTKQQGDHRGRDTWRDLGGA
jgi:hypothetical protein